jgi:hypothetical protein
MPISDPEWESINTFVGRIVKKMVGQRSDYFVTGQVLKVDEPNKCIFMREFGDQPIPIVGFDYEVSFYDESPKGTTTPAEGIAAPYNTYKKTAKVTVVMPKKGQTVLVAREMGTHRLPRCLGVIQGKRWIVPEED